MASGLFGGDEAREKKGNSEESNRVHNRKSHKKPKNPNSAPQLSPSQILPATEDSNYSQPPRRFDAVTSDYSSVRNLQPQVAQKYLGELANRTGLPEYSTFEDRVKIDVNSRSKSEIREFRRLLVGELDQVRGLMKKLQGVVDRGGSAIRVNSEVGSNSKPFGGLTVSTAENNEQWIGEAVEKEKKATKAKQYYQNSGFASGKESKKKLKSDGGKRDEGGDDLASGLRTDSQSSPGFKICVDLLAKLMKHKFSWVFNKPVDVKGLGLHDYYTIIKHPMDLGTVKNRLNKSWYKSPREFAADVRLTFSNAMLYNPTGQDVYCMAEQLSRIFEEQWKPMEGEFNRNRRIEFGLNAGLPPPSRKTPMPTEAPDPAPPPVQMRTLDRSESKTMPVEPKLKPSSYGQLGRAPPVLKKPKAKDPDKRDMSYEEKQRLSMQLQSLPSEKLDNIVQIIKERNPGLFQQDDEIEVDIASVDPETLWELDRFVTNYKKSLSKNKRKAELALQSEAES